MSNKVLLSSDKTRSIFENAKKIGSLREAYLAHDDSEEEEVSPTYGFSNPEYLSSEEGKILSAPLLPSNSWAELLLSSVTRSPFSKVRSVYADISEDEAKASGFTTGKQKKENILTALKKVVSPQTVYKKLTIDRDEFLDIDDFDKVAWIRSALKNMLDESIARAILVGDKLDATNESHISEDHVVSVASAGSSYVLSHNFSTEFTTENFIDEVSELMADYRGSGMPVMFIDQKIFCNNINQGDTNRDVTIARLAERTMTSMVVLVPGLYDDENGEETSPFCVIFNPRDYTIGCVKDGEEKLFDDFDIDYNKQKYLLETRISGLLTRPKSAVVISKTNVVTT